MISNLTFSLDNGGPRIFLAPDYLRGACLYAVSAHGTDIVVV